MILISDHDGSFDFFTFNRPPTVIEIISIVCLLVIIALTIWLCVATCRQDDDDDDESCIEMEHPGSSRFVIVQRGHPPHPSMSDHYAQVGAQNYYNPHQPKRGEMIYPPPYESAMCYPANHVQPSAPPYGQYVQPPPQQRSPSMPSAPPYVPPTR